MGPFAAVERFFERIFERSSARLFHARLQPIQLQRRVERAMEAGRLSTGDRVVVPNRYVLRLAPRDVDAFGDLADSLELELSEAALHFARAHHYTVADRPAVRIVDDPTIARGDVRVDVSFSDGAVASARPRGSAPPPQPAPAPGRQHQRSAEPTERPAQPAIPQPAEPPAQPSVPAQHSVPEPAAPAPADAPARAASSIRTAGRPRAAADEPLPPRPTFDPTRDSVASIAAAPAARPAAAPTPASPPIDINRTMVFQVPTQDAPHAVLRQVGPDGRHRDLVFDGGPITIGRATDNFLVLRDARVSRYHGRLASRQGALVYRDLGSTNGSRVNGVEIDEVVLGAGDRIELGDTVLVVESVRDA